MEIKNKKSAIELLKSLIAFLGGNDEQEASAEAFSIPTVEEIGEMDADAASELAGKCSIDTDGVKPKALKKLLCTLSTIANDTDEEVEEEDINSLAEALGLTPDKKAEKTVAAIKKLAASFGEEAEAPAEEEAEEPSDDDDDDDKEKDADEDDDSSDDDDDSSDDADEDEDEEDEKKSKKSKKSKSEDEDDDDADAEEPSEDEDDDADESKEEDEPSEDDKSTEGDGVDREEVASSFKKFPDLKIMVKHLTAYNEAKGEDDAIEFNAKKEKDVKAAYLKLVAELVDSESNIAKWGTPYIRDGEGYCCGLPLGEGKGPKGEKRPVGVCAVTEKKFAFNEEDSSFDELE